MQLKLGKNWRNRSKTDQSTGNRTLDRTVSLDFQQPPPPPPAVRVRRETGQTTAPELQSISGQQAPSANATARTDALSQGNTLSMTPDGNSRPTAIPQDMPSATVAKTRMSVGYLSLWGLAGLMAAAYIFVIVAKPSMFANILPVQNPTTPETNEGQRAAAKAVAELDSRKMDVSSEPERAIVEPETGAREEPDTSSKQAGLTETVEPKDDPSSTVQASTVPAIPMTETPETETGAIEPPNASEQSATDVSKPETATVAVPKILNASPTTGSEKSDTTVSFDPPEPVAESKTATNQALTPPVLDPAGELADATAALETASVDDSSEPDASNADVETPTTVDIALPERKGSVPQEFLDALKTEKDAALARAQTTAESTIAAATSPSAASGFDVTSTTSATGSASTTAGGFGEPIVTRAPNSIGVILASGPSVDALRLSWSLLAENYAGALGALTPRYTSSPGPDGPTYTLVAGPLESDKAAEDVCISVIARGIPCRPATYTGNAL